MDYLKTLTCNDCGKFNDDMACIGCSAEDSIIRNGKLCSGFVNKDEKGTSHQLYDASESVVEL